MNFASSSLFIKLTGFFVKKKAIFRPKNEFTTKQIHYSISSVYLFKTESHKDTKGIVITKWFVGYNINIRLTKLKAGNTISIKETPQHLNI